MANTVSAAPLKPFDSQLRTRVVFGPGTVARVGELVRETGGRRVLLVTDRGIVAAGHAERVKGLLQDSGLEVVCYDDVEQNPTSACVAKCAAMARSSGIDSLIGLGGGSSMDTARGCNFVLTNGGEMKDYWGIGKARLPMLPLIAIPTTAGTGSECQSFALISDDTTHQKMACGDPKAAARIAILDPELTLSQPASVTALTGIDALAHAVESSVTKKRNPVSILYSTEAFRLVCRGLPRVLGDPTDLEARGFMLLGAAWAGTAIENSMLGAAHSAANPLTSQFNIVHGQAVGLMLPHVIRFNSESDEAAQTYHHLLNAAGVDDRNDPGETLAALVDQFLNQAAIPARLGALGVSPGAISKLATEAARQWTAQYNPRPVLEQDFSTLYTRAL